MTVATFRSTRWQRAQQIDPSCIEEMGWGWYVAPSSRQSHSCSMDIEFDGEDRVTVAPAALDRVVICARTY